MNPLHKKALKSSIFGTIILCVMIFLPAGTFTYWQGWTYIVTFVVATTLITVALAKQSPALLERRMKAGPTAEKDPAQKLIMTYASLGFIAGIFVPAIDRRFGWSAVPSYASIIGDACILVGFYIVYRVLKQNQFAASTIQVENAQTVTTTGMYAVVRHPMYAGALPILLCTPLALGSWWGLLVFPLAFPALALRLLNEEKFLQKNLNGYTEYMKKVKYRLIPRVW